MPSLQESFSWRGRTVAWDRVGSGPPVVMCHGTPWSSALWRPVAEALADRWTVHLWDMPGYGQSSMRPEHNVDLGVQGEMFADLLRAWRLDRPHVVAHDFGGAVSLRALLLHGATYGSLCLVDVVALRPWGSPFFRLVAEHAEVFTRLPMPMHTGLVEKYVETAAHRPLDPEQLSSLVDPWTSPEGQPAFYRQIAQADERFTAEFEPLLGDVEVPTQVVWGREDAWIPVEQAQRLATAIPGAGLDLVDEAGHLIQYDAPEALASAISNWLDHQA